MPDPEEAPRPQAVTVIGWVWLVLGVLFLFRALVNMVLWKMLQPDFLTFLDILGEVPRQQRRLLRPIFENMTALQAGEAFLSAAIIVIAIELLRLRPWARVGMQAVCWMVIVGLAAFGVFWFWLWRTVVVAAPPAQADSLGRIGLVVGLGVCLVLAAGLAIMIAFLRGSRVRAAFNS